MPEPITTETVETTEITEAPDLGDAGKKAIAAERKRADGLDKELKALRLDAETRANAELSELERLKKENAELHNTTAANTLATTRLQVALDKGIPANLAARLQGNDYDTLAADADSLSELIKGSTTTRTPRADPSVGPRNEGTTGSVQAGRDLFANSRTKTS